MEIETSKVDFKSLFKVVRIDINIVTFRRYEIERNASLVAKEGYETVKLGKEIGEEVHVCKPEVVAELAGKVGLTVKGFEIKIMGKKNKKVIVDKIIYL